MNGTNGNGWLARQLSVVLDKYGLGTMLSIVLVGFLLWVYNVRLDRIEEKQNASLVKQDAMAVQVDLSRGDAKVLNALLSRVVIVLESMDRRMCLRDARDARERDACVAAPK